MNRSGWHIPGSYLLLSALVYLALGIMLELDDTDGMLGLGLVAGVNLAAQGVFAILIAPSRYVAVIPAWRLVLGSLYVGALLALQAYAVAVTLAEARVAEMASSPEKVFAWWMLVFTLILGAPAALWAWCRRADRLAVLKRLGLCVAAGALGSLSIVVPVYLLLVKGHNEGFLYGLASRLAIFTGLLTLAWSLGPLFLFLHVRRLRRGLRGQCPACGYDLHGLSQMRCPECGRAFTFEEVRATAQELRVVKDGGEG